MSVEYDKCVDVFLEHVVILPTYITYHIDPATFAMILLDVIVLTAGAYFSYTTAKLLNYAEHTGPTHCCLEALLEIPNLQLLQYCYPNCINAGGHKVAIWKYTIKPLTRIYTVLANNYNVDEPNSARRHRGNYIIASAMDFCPFVKVEKRHLKFLHKNHRPCA